MFLLHSLQRCKIKDLDVIFFDTETSGDDPEKDQVIQLAGVGCNLSQPQKRKGFNAFISLEEGVEINPEAQEVHGITPEFLKKNGRPTKKVFKAWGENFVGSNPVLLVAHHAIFDCTMMEAHKNLTGIPFLNEVLYEEPVLDTHFLARALYFDPPKYKLDSLVEYFNIAKRESDVHDALEDCNIGMDNLIAILTPFMDFGFSWISANFQQAFCNFKGIRGRNVKVESILRKANDIINKNEGHARMSFCKSGKEVIDTSNVILVETKKEHDDWYLGVRFNMRSKIYTFRVDRIHDLTPIG